MNYASINFAGFSGYCVYPWRLFYSKFFSSYLFYLEEKIKRCEGVEILYPVDGNMIFAKLPAASIPKLLKKSHFYVMDKEKNIVRLVTSFDTRKEEIEVFVKYLNSFVG